MEGALNSAGTEPGEQWSVSARVSAMEAHPLSPPALSASFLLEHLYFSFRITWSLATAADALIGDMSSQISLTSWLLSSRFCFTIALTTLLCSTDFTQLPVLFHQSPPLTKEQRKQAV